MSDLGVGREAESRAVDEFLLRVAEGPTALVIEGEPGIGKTTVWLDAVQRAVDAGCVVLSARGAAAEARLNYAALADLLGHLEPAVLDDLPPVQRAAVQAVLLRGTDETTADERALAAAFLTIVERLSDAAPVIVGIDDVQWLDVSSRVIVGFAARRLRGRIGLLMTARTGEPGVADIATWLHMPRPEALTRIRLKPLSLESLHGVVRTRVGRTLPRPLMARVHALSGGNPFYAIEFARALGADSLHSADGMPESLAEVVNRRLGAVDGEAADLLLTAASAAAPTIDLLSLAMDVTPNRVVDALGDAEAAGVVRIDGPRVSFTHPLLAHGVYSRAEPAQRRSTHARLAAVVDQPEVRARHLALGADSDPATLEALDHAAARAARRGAYSAAAELLDLAITVGGDTVQRRLRAAEQHFRAGALQQAQTHLDHLEPHLTGGALSCAALILRAAVEGHSRSIPDAVTALNDALRHAESDGLRQRVLHHLTPMEILLGDRTSALEHARDAVALADRMGDPALRSQALTSYVFARFLNGMGVDRTALTAALELKDCDVSAAPTAHADGVAAVITGWEGRLEDARTALRTVARHFSDRGAEIDVLFVAGHAAMVDIWLGRYADAERIADDALRRAEAMGGHLVVANALSNRAAVAAYTGHAAEARDGSRAALAAAHACRSSYLSVAPLACLAFVEVSVGDYAAALDVLTPLLASFDPDRDTEIVLGGYLPDAVEALCALGRVDEAEPLTAALEANGTRLDRPWALATGARCRGLIDAARGSLAAATHDVELAMSHHARLPMPFERARTLLLQGQLQRRRRQRQAAATSLTDALTAFEELGSPLWAARSRAELDRLSASGRQGSVLTPAEQRVADLAAAGLSNKEIAGELFLAPKTVEMNLSAVYRKLGIRSRAQLFARLNAEDGERR
ncbi:AAA family ATPase [Mycobacterium sp. MYCO198283]|uniref:AAA family ATPase n=1 Tax=Mycobacterium sp. MYCO198283 TaxID=2883505 RepID=UPI001E46814B|nr:AAA family ATPase [Mycobacterium sp. MYCO198283]MCG5432266.1 AAA family ATPase [Mycobacterium sp. MYCO198283]